MLSMRGPGEGRGVLNPSIIIVCNVRDSDNDSLLETTQPAFSVGPSLFTKVYVFSGDYWYERSPPVK